MSAPISLAKLFHLIPEGSALDRDPDQALQKLTSLEQNRSLYQSLGYSEAVQSTEAKIQTLFRPFDRDEYLTRIAATALNLRSADEDRFSAALDQAQEISEEYAPRLLRGIAVNLREEAEGFKHRRWQNRMVLKAFEAAATTQVEALYLQERRDSARALGIELKESLGRIAQSLQSGTTPLEAVQAERALHPVSHFVEMYYESGLCDLIPEISRPDAEFAELLVRYAETLESYGHFSGAQILAETLESNLGAGLQQRAAALLNRIPEEALTEERYQFLFNLGGITAESNVAVLKMGATAASFVGANALGRLTGLGSAELIVSAGASKIEAGLTAHLAETLTIGATQPLIAPGAENLTLDSYLGQFGHLAGLTGALGIRAALMRDIDSSLLQYAGTIGTMTAYDYATEPEIRNLPFGLNLANVIGNDLLMRSGQILAYPRAWLPSLEIEKSDSSRWLIPFAASLAGCDTAVKAPVTIAIIGIVTWMVRGMWRGIKEYEGIMSKYLTRPINSASVVKGPTKTQVPEMVSIPGGSFVRGSARGEYNSEPARWVSVPPFQMSKSPITSAQWVSYISDPENSQYPYALFGRNIASGFDEVLDRGKSAEELSNLLATRRSNPELWHYEGIERSSGLRKIFDKAPQTSDLLKRRIAGEYADNGYEPESFRLIRPLTESSDEDGVFQSHDNWQIHRIIPDQFYADGPEHPVTAIDYWSALAYANSLGMRLPTAAEWEFATGPSVSIQEKIQAEKDQNPLENWKEWIEGPAMPTPGRSPDAPATWGRYENFTHGLKIFDNPQDPELISLLKEGALIFARRVFPTREGYYEGLEIPSSVYRRRPKTRPTSEGVLNEYGLIDMGGNIRQWVMTKSASREFILRGNSAYDYRPTTFRTRFQFTEAPNTAALGIGFRVVLDL